MGTAGEKNLWAEWTATSPPLYSTRPLVLSSFHYLHHTACCRCAYALNNKCLSGSPVGQKLWLREHMRAREINSSMAAGKGMSSQHTWSQRKTHIYKNKSRIRIRIAEEWNMNRKETNSLFQLVEAWPPNSLSRIWLSEGQTSCRNQWMLSCGNLAVVRSFISRKWGYVPRKYLLRCTCIKPEVIKSEACHNRANLFQL